MTTATTRPANMNITRITPGYYEVTIGLDTYILSKHTEGSMRGMWNWYDANNQDVISDPVETMKQAVAELAAVATDAMSKTLYQIVEEMDAAETATAAYIAPVAEVQQAATTAPITQADVDAAFAEWETAKASNADKKTRLNALKDAMDLKAEFDAQPAAPVQDSDRIEYNAATGLFDAFHNGMWVASANSYLKCYERRNEFVRCQLMDATAATAADPSTLSDEEVLEVVALCWCGSIAEYRLGDEDLCQICSQQESLWCARENDQSLETEALVVDTLLAEVDSVIFPDDCPECGGSGKIDTSYPMGNEGWERDSEACPTCTPLPFTPTAAEKQVALLELEAMASTETCRCGAAIAYRHDGTNVGVCRACRDQALIEYRDQDWWAESWVAEHETYLIELLAA